MQSKQQAKPQISGIEKTIIDNSPQLRRDVEQLANERSLLSAKVMDNEARFNYLRRKVNETPERFMTPREVYAPRNLSRFEGDSLRLPSMSEEYDKEVKLFNDGTDVPIVDASTSFKRSTDVLPEPVIVKEEEDERKNTESLKPKALFADNTLYGNLFTPERVRSTSPRPQVSLTPSQKTPEVHQLYKYTPNTRQSSIKKIAEKQLSEIKQEDPETTITLEELINDTEEQVIPLGEQDKQYQASLAKSKAEREKSKAELEKFQAVARRQDEFLQTIEKNKAEQENRSQSKKKTDDLPKETIVPKEPTSEQRKKSKRWNEEKYKNNWKNQRQMKIQH
jgi:hypothetical protein